jgi:hypothetical protein
VRFAGAGLCTLQAAVGEANNYQAATGAPQSFTINKAAGSVTINNKPASGVYGGSFSPSFSKTGDGATSVASLTTGTCTVSSGVVSYTGIGTCTLRASVAEGTYYLAATGAAQSFSIARAPGSVSISNIPLRAVVGGYFTPAFTKLGNGATSVVSLTTSVCTVSTGGRVNYLRAGTCTLRASVAAGTNYLAATGAPQSFSISR